MKHKKHSKIVHVPAKVKARIKAGLTKQHLIPNPVVGGDGSARDPYTPTNLRAKLFSALEQANIKPVHVCGRNGAEVVLLSKATYDILIGVKKHPLDLIGDRGVN